MRMLQYLFTRSCTFQTSFLLLMACLIALTSIFSIHGLDREHPSLIRSGLHLLRNISIVKFSYDPNDIVGKGAGSSGINHAATRLQDMLVKYCDELDSVNHLLQYFVTFN